MALAEEALKSIFSKRLTTARADREAHGRDESFHEPALPDMVVYPQTTEEVAEIAKICHQYAVPMIPFGVGTSLEGHVAALKGGVSIDLSRMNRVLEVRREDLLCMVEPGVTRKQLNTYLRDTGLFFPVDPGADATLGGMCATGASGTTTVRYGAMRENVLALTVVTPQGDIIETGGRARKSSAGYDLTRLFVGSEGTLGMITRLTLRLYGIPEQTSAAVCAFETVADAVNAVIATIQSGLQVARIEFLDELQVKACNQYSDLTLEELPTLFLEFHGTNETVERDANRFGELAREFGARDLDWATKPEDRNRLWAARHNAYYAGLNLRPGAQGLTTDVCVPISRLATCVEETKKDITASGLIAPIVGHVGDGNFHVIVLVDPEDREALKEAEAFNERTVERALNMGGTCTGEHGVGYGKMAWLAKEHASALPMMKSIKAALDPKGIMNPGKVVDKA